MENYANEKGSTFIVKTVLQRTGKILDETNYTKSDQAFENKFNWVESQKRIKKVEVTIWEKDVHGKMRIYMGAFYYDKNDNGKPQSTYSDY